MKQYFEGLAQYSSSSIALTMALSGMPPVFTILPWLQLASNLLVHVLCGLSMCNQSSLVLSKPDIDSLSIKPINISLFQCGKR